MSSPEPIWQTTRRAPFHAPPLKQNHTTEILVVGAGISGLTSALLLAEQGRRVTVIDAEDVGAGTTSATSAHLTTLPDERYSVLERRFDAQTTRALATRATAALEQIARIVQQYEIACDFARVSGYYYAEEARDSKQIEDEAAACERAGLSITRDPENPLPFEVAAIFEVHDQAIFHPLDYLDGLARAAQQRGVQIFSKARMTELEHQEGQVIAHIEGSPHQITATRVIHATHTPQGIHALHVALPAYRSYMLSATLTEEPPAGLFWDTADPYHYSRRYQDPQGAWQWLVGGADHKTGTGGELKSEETLRDYVEQRYPVKTITHQWSAQWYQPTDGLPLLGDSPGKQGELVITGLSGDGLIWGTMGAMLLERQLAHTREEDPFAPARGSLALTLEFLKAGVETSRNMVLDRLTGAEPITLDELLPCQGAIVRQGLENVAAFREQGGKLHLFSATCPHMHGIVHYNPEQQSFDCPCHGARFDAKTGEPLDGPTAMPLTRLEQDS